MAILIFSSSVGVALDIHYCKDEIKSLGFFHSAKDCYQLAGFETPEKHHDQKTNSEAFFKQKDCCSNESVLFQLDTDFSLPTLFDFNFDQDFYVFHQPSFNSADEPVDFYSPNNYKNYKPPLLEKDHIVLIQSFLL